MSKTGRPLAQVGPWPNSAHSVRKRMAYGGQYRTGLGSDDGLMLFGQTDTPYGHFCPQNSPLFVLSLAVNALTLFLPLHLYFLSTWCKGRCLARNEKRSTHRWADASNLISDFLNLDFNVFVATQMPSCQPRSPKW